MEMGGLLALCFLLGYVVPLRADVQCGYTPPTAQDVSYCIRDRTTHQARKRQMGQAIRVVPWFHSTVEALGPEKKRIIQEDVVPELLTFVSQTLSVTRLQSSLVLSRTCQGNRFVDPNVTRCEGPCAASTMCGPIITVPDNHLSACLQCNGQGNGCTEAHTRGPGVADADYVLYVAADERTPCAASQSNSVQIIAFAAHCQLEPDLDRPVAGYINLCPNALSSRNLRATVKHELLHALGFSSALFPFFRDSSGMPRTSRDRSGFPPTATVNGNTVFQAGDTTVTTVPVTRETNSGPQTYNVQYLVTPAVQREARAHFGCPSLPGLELENQGGSATAGSHWEKRITENEAMTGQITQNPAFSRLTLAILEDSGWYGVNYDSADPFRFGKDLGCNFAQQSCFSWMQMRQNAGQSLEPFCEDQQSPTVVRTSCTPDRLSVGRCNLVKYSGALDSRYRYFSDSSLGGSVELTDYCPYYLEVRFDTGRITTCSNSSSQPLPSDNLFAETYGSNSRCVRHGSMRNWDINGQTFPNRGGSGCYEFTCSPSNGLIVSVLGVDMACECEGKEVLFTVSSSGKTFRGSILCPSCSDICWDTPERCPATETAACPGTTQDVQGTGSTLHTPPGSTSGARGTAAAPLAVAVLLSLVANGLGCPTC